MPVAQEGTVTQELVQTIDPTKLKLTAESDITYPSGWTLSVSFDGTTFTTTLPTVATGSATSWDKVVAVKANGPIVSKGASNGYQIAEGSATGTPTAATSAYVTAVATADPHYTFFNASRTLAFFVAHHSSGNILGCTVIATNSTCNGFPMNPGVSSNSYAVGKVINGRVWFPGQNGLACVDIRRVEANPTTATPTSCGVYTDVVGYETDLMGGWASSQEQQFWYLDWSNGTFSCFDTGTRQACGKIQTEWNPTTTDSWGYFHRIGDYLFSRTRTDTKKALCYRISTGSACPGFPKTFTAGVGRPIPLPDPTGTIIAYCYDTDSKCFDFSGNAYTAPTSFMNNLVPNQQEIATVVGTRVYTSNRNYSNASTARVVCWDAAKNNGAGGACYDGYDYYAYTNYTVTPDPLLPDCLWITQDPSPYVRTIDMRTKTNGCSAPGVRVLSLAGTTAVPRMACGTTGSGTIRQWRTLDLTTPASNTYTSVTLSVTGASGSGIPGWQQVPVTSWPLDISALDPAVTGASPQFQLTFQDLDAAVTSATVNVTAVGDSPQLCITPQSTLTCPAVGSGLGYVTGLPSATTSTVTASGTAVDASNNSMSVGPVSQTVDLGVPAPDQCGGRIRGTTMMSGTGSAVAGVVVRLLNSSGSAVLGADSQPITATTDANGNYSFDNLKPGNYKVSFDADNGTPASGTQYADYGVGLAGPDTANATSYTLAVVTSQTDVVNATYPTPLTAVNDTSSGAQGAVQTKDLTSNDVPTTGKTLTKSSVYLCDDGQSDAACKTAAARTKTVSGVGTYTVNATTGVMTFTPDPSYVGTPPPLTYVISDSGGSTTSATYTPTVAGAPTAVADTTNGAYGVTQSKNLLSNDTTDPAVTFDTASVRLCDTGETAPACTKTSLTRPEGTYTLVNGTITFTPATGYTGTPQTPVAYAVTDSSGQQSHSTYTPTVAPPAAPTASPETKAVIPGGTVAFTTVTGANGLATGSGLKTGASDGPCLVASSNTTPSTGCVTSLTTIDGSWAIDQTTGVVSFTANNNVAVGVLVAVGYRVTDAVGQPATSTLTPVAPIPPNAVADTTDGDYGATQSKNLLLNDTTDPAVTFDTASVRLCDTGETAPACTKTSLSRPEGVYSLTNGTITFAPASGYSGTPQTPIPYSVTDSTGQQAHSTYTPTVAPLAPPAGVADTTSGFAGMIQSIDPMANDTLGGSPNVVSFVTSSVKLCDAGQTPPNCNATNLTNTAGTYQVNVNTGAITFTPASRFSGVAPAVTYQVTDTLGGVGSSTYVATVIAPVAASPDTSTGLFSATQTTDLLLNDTVDPSASFDSSSVRLCDAGETAPSCTKTTVARPEGTYSLTGGTITFTPAEGYSGTPATPVAYSVTDSLGQRTHSTYTPTVTPPAAPTATPERKAVTIGGTVAFTTTTGTNGLATGTGLKTGTSGGASFVCPVTRATTCSATQVVIANEGTWSMDQTTGIATFTAASSVTTSGDLTPVTYRVTDAAGQTATATLTPVITPPPSASNDTSTGEQGKEQTVSLVGNDAVGNTITSFDPVTVKLCAPGTTAPCSLTTVIVPGEGTYRINPNGTLTFTPDKDFVGTATPLTYTVVDTLGQPATATLTITVAPPPFPAAQPDTANGAYGQDIVFSPWLNDSPGTTPEGSTRPAPQLVPTSIRLCGPGQNAPTCDATTLTTPDGTYSVDTKTGKVTFTPAAGFTGTATQPVTYQIANNWTGANGIGVTTSILIPTTQAPDAPVAVDDTATTNGKPVAIDPLTNDTATTSPLDPTTLRLCDANETAPTCTRTSVTTTQGTFSVDTTTGKVTFRPNKNFTGTATITYVIADRTGKTTFATIRITSLDSNDQITAAGTPTRPKGDTIVVTGINAFSLISIIAIGLLLAGTTTRALTRQTKPH